jgi:ABC-type molybdate transport system ATPase subunit
LSGGEQQRVALGRALSARPGVLLLDEPLSALDDETREGLYGLLKSIQVAEGVTILHVTHSLTEANRLADQLLVLRDGAIHSESLNSPVNGSAIRAPRDLSPPLT